MPRHLLPVLVAWVFTCTLLRSQSAVIVVDAFNRKVHVAGNANAKRAVGGLAKIATGMVALDWATASKVGVGVLPTVPSYAPQIAGSPSPLGLLPGDSMTLRDLIYATMMGSDNIAAITIGDFIGRDHLARLQRSGHPTDEFVRLMNQLAAREGCTTTRFTNPHGLENSRPQPYSTAADIARLTVYAVSRPAMRFYTNQASRAVTIYRAGQQISVTVENTNRLLGVDLVDGVKTANTYASGGCCAISAERPSSVTVQADNSSLIFKHRMIVVVLGSADPFGEARGLLQQGWVAYDRWMAAGRPITDKKQMLADF